jgi:hypothetical protein
MTQQPSTFYVLHLLLVVFLETVGVVTLPGVAGLEVENAVVGAAESEVFALVFVAAELSPEVVVLVVEPGVVLVAVVSTAHVSEPQASVGIPVVSHVLIPVSVVVLVGLDSPGHPKFFALPNICSFPNCSSSVEVVG